MSRRRMRLPWHRRVGYTLLLTLMVVLLVEAFSWVLFGLVTEDSYSPHGLSAQRSALVKERLRAGAVLFQDVQIPWRRSHAFHPYLGYVRNPESLIAGEDEHFGTSEYGFLVGAPAPRQRADDTVLVGLFGGSFAAMFYQDAAQVLAEELGRSPRFAGKRFHFLCGAVGGYKQPQQLMSLSYLQVIGQEFDLVVNLDGYNEVVLYPTVMQNLDMFPAYPRNWNLLTSDVNNYVQQLADQVNGWRKSRKTLARRLQSSVLRHSITVNLLWKLRDRTLESQILEAQERAANPPEEAELAYEQTGPPRHSEDPAALVEELVDLWSRSSRQMQSVAAAGGARYFHFLQPNQYAPPGKPMGEEEREIALEKVSRNAPHVQAGYARMQQAGQLLRSEGEAFFDLTDVFQDVEEPVYIDTCCHVNPEGAAIVARRMARCILEVLDTEGR